MLTSCPSVDTRRRGELAKVWELNALLLTSTIGALLTEAERALVRGRRRRGQLQRGKLDRGRRRARHGHRHGRGGLHAWELRRGRHIRERGPPWVDRRHPERDAYGVREVVVVRVVRSGYTEKYM